MKSVVENFTMESIQAGAVSGRLRHCYDNSLSKQLKENERVERKMFLKENFAIAGSCKSIDEIKEKIKKASEVIKTKRNKFPLKEVVGTIYIPKEFTKSQQKQIMSEWMSEVMRFWNSKGVESMMVFYHGNEKGALYGDMHHYHLIIKNFDLKNKKWGWELGKLKPNQIRGLHKEFDEMLFKFSSKWKLPYMDRKSFTANLINEKKQKHKHVNVWDYKKSFNEKGFDNGNNSIKSK